MARAPRVWCWPDLWRAVAEDNANAPARLSDAGARAVLGLAIDRARRDGELDAIAEILAWPGFRRRLRTRIGNWTRDEGEGPTGDAVVEAQRTIFRRYRKALNALDAEDAEGFAVWASKALRSSPPASLKRLGTVIFLDPPDETQAAWRALKHAEENAEAVHVALAFDPDKDLVEAYAETAPLRSQLIKWGFVETRVERDASRPKGLIEIERTLFHSKAHTLEPLHDATGLKLIGAPQGEGSALVLAREVRGLLDNGADPEDVLILFRRWDDDAALARETLQAWGLPVAAEVDRPLSTDPAVSALRLAIRLPIDGWESADLVRLLRNSQVQPRWPERSSIPDALAVAASTVQASRVHRGRESILKALDRLIKPDRTSETEAKAWHAPLARAVVGRMFDLLGGLDQPGTWGEQVARLRRLAATFQLGQPDVEGIEALWCALDDHGAAIQGLSRKERTWTWKAFADEVDALAGDLTIPAPAALPGTVRLATVDDLAGARARHIVLANLGEGTFPVRAAVESDLTRKPGGKHAIHFDYAREMLRFLRVVGSAEMDVTLIYPTTDVKGQELLPAGFLDDVVRRLDEDALRSCRTEDSRFDPALIDRPDLAGAPADARVRAVALACQANDRAALIELAGRPRQRAALEGTAAALAVGHERTRSRAFGRYDGILRAPAVIERIEQKFGAHYPFSPSQIESFLFCPFQFFLRYVLKLQPVDERDELEEDYTERGSKIHRILEQLELLRARQEQSRLELADILIATEMRVELTAESPIDAGLNAIEQRRLSRTIARYVQQHETYDRKEPGVPPEPHQFEAVFGHGETNETSYPGLSIGAGETAVRLQGKIDRIDLVRSPAGLGFRIIDYKSGSCPSKKDVKEALYLQLPLYAMAVERIILAGDGDKAGDATALHDVGYWGLRGDGYKPIPLPAWPEDQVRLEEFVVAIVALLRHGEFPVSSRKTECAQRCEYSAVCRVEQVRAAGKRRDDVPQLLLTIK